MRGSLIHADSLKRYLDAVKRAPIAHVDPVRHGPRNEGGAMLLEPLDGLADLGCGKQQPFQVGFFGCGRMT